MFYIIVFLTFLSGAAGLMYEVLWMKQLGFLFGNSAEASAATLSAFFLGLGAGSIWWGRRVGKLKNSIAGYALLECGVFGSALLYLLFLMLFHDLYPALLHLVQQQQALGLVIKCGLAILLVSPGAFFMGGTIPLTGQMLIKENHQFGRTSAIIYCVNTLGAAVGALLAGFYLPYLVGFHKTYCMALGLTGLVALVAGLVAWLKPAAHGEAVFIQGAVEPSGGALDKRVVLALCFISGFGTLSLEVIWTQMLAHVFQNSVYTFAAILVVTLVCLAIGAGVSHVLSRCRWSPVKVLSVILIASGVSVGLSSFHLMALTENLKYFTGSQGWDSYIWSVFSLSFTVTGLPLVLSGVLFPYLLKMSEGHVSGAGRTLGNLYAINTLGAVLGPLVTGFMLIKWFGLWHAIQLFSMLYLAIVVFLPVGYLRRGSALAFLVLMATIFAPTDLITMRVRPGEKIIEHWNGPNGTLAVVQKGPFLKLLANGHYGLGSTEGEAAEKDQTSIPLLLHPEAKSIFFLGVGTGLTAGEAVLPKYGLERIVACELSPDVIDAARKHFGAFTNGLFEDPRARVIADDGRHYLSTTSEKFDIIVADLFVVYDKGAGDLYTREHFENASKRVQPGGIFVQWIPLYQLTQKEFHVIAKTMMDVYPQVTVWRSLFLPNMDAIALVGQNEVKPLFGQGYTGAGPKGREQAAAQERQGELRPNSNTLLLYYCGNLAGAKEVVKDSPMNTEDYPVIEYMTPRSSSLQAADKIVWFAGPQFLGLVDKMLTNIPPESDPALSGLSLNERLPARAGFSLARSYLLKNAYDLKVPGSNEMWLKVAEDDYRKYLETWLK